MYSILSRLTSALLLSSVLVLAGCETSEQRAERFYQSGMALLAAGDVDRALVEFRNVFRLNGQHKEARLTYARLVRERGKAGEAYGQYLRLAEQYPDLLEARVALAEIAIEGNSWDEAERHGRAARDLAPTDPDVVLINAVLDYRAAVLAKDTAAAEPPIAVARAALEADPANLMARRLVIDAKLNAGDRAGALPDIAEGIKAHPDEFALYMLQTQILNETGDATGTEAALEEMAARFPENAEVRQTLIAWYMQNGDTPAAEAFLRQLSEAPDATDEAKLTVVEFLRQTKGNEAAMVEIDRLVALEPDNATFRTLRNGLIFEQGKTTEAIADMEALLKDAEPSDETRNLKVALAKMLEETGNQVGARGRIEEVLAEDPNHVEALKMQAGWLIAEDKPGEAILALRTALAEAPRDIAVITMMGEAHEREGARDLAGERYALAVEISGRAPLQSLRYAGFLLTDDKYNAAEAVLEDALQANPDNLSLLVGMAEVQLRQRNWGRTASIIDRLRALNTAQSNEAANGIESELLLRQERVDDTLTFLSDLVSKGDAGTVAKARIVQIQVQNGRIDEAGAFLDEELAKTPDDPTMRFLRAGVHVLENQPEQAEAMYRALLETAPNDQTLQALYGLLVAQGRGTEALALIDGILAETPDAIVPQLLKAGYLERSGDFEGAIAIYEALYAANSNNLVIANNLASMITTHRTDPADLERAYAIARRLRGSDVAAFQDTYGWIAYRRGDHEEALRHLEPAAAGLPDDPLVQFHLGMTYAALKQTAKARETLTRALEVAGDNPLPQFDEARATLQTLGSE